MNSSAVLRPPALKPGDLIGIAAPASSFDREAFAQGCRMLEEAGLEVYFRDDIFSREHYLAGPRQRRLDELKELCHDPRLKALFFARGGYGLMHLLSDVDPQWFAAFPRVVLGHSDLTPLLNQLVERVGLMTFHGPLVAGLSRTASQSLDQLWSLLCTADAIPSPYQGRPGPGSAGGTATGRLCGGNLSLIAATCGTPFALDTTGRILILEDIGERPYRIDRLLQQLELSGTLGRAAGIAVGEFTACEESGGRGRPIEDILTQFLEPLGIPIVTGLPFGHGSRNDTVPLGALALLHADQGTLQVLEAVVR